MRIVIDNHYYRIYYADCVKLAMSVVIKLNTTIDMVNQFIKLKFGEEAVDINDPSSWKWYRNVCGEYHFSDTMMTVKSLDTQEEIPFTKEMLAEHPSTKEAYQFGTRYCRLLMERYPEQETLIMGVLYPAQMDVAIGASDGQIISYPLHLVETQEETLILDLTDHIQKHLARWRVEAFAYTHSLYLISEVAILYTTLVPKILNLRLARCKTHEVHSFHVRMFLASHGRLDRFLPYMTLRQSLFLYRNIDYILKHAGRRDTFMWLVDRILTERNIPISEFSIRHIDHYDENYRVDYWIRKQSLNPQINTSEKTRFSLKEVLTKEVNQAPYNDEYVNQHYERIHRSITNSASSVIQSKDLESDMVDRSDSRPYRFTDVLIDHWAYLSHKGEYRGVYVVHNDALTGELVSLSTRDAFIYFMYVLAFANGIQLQKIPHWYASKVVRYPRPTISDLERHIPWYHIPQPKLAQSLLQTFPRLKRLNSRKAFYEWTRGVYNQYLHHVGVVSNSQTPLGRGATKMMTDRLTMGVNVVFDDTGSNYDNWLSVRGLSLENYTKEDAQRLIKNLIEGSTGYSIDESQLLINIQRAMIGIIKQLSSYSIQFIQDINEEPIRPLNWAAIRVDAAGSVAGQITRIKTCYQLNPTSGSAELNRSLSCLGEMSSVIDGGSIRRVSSCNHVHQKLETSQRGYRVWTRGQMYSDSMSTSLDHFNQLPSDFKQALFMDSIGESNTVQIGLTHLADLVSPTISLNQLFKDES